MDQYQLPVLTQEHRLKISPRMFQSMQLMTLPLQDLKFRIHEELEKNPALELIEDKSIVSIEDYSNTSNENFDNYFTNRSDLGYSNREGREASDKKQKFIEGALSRPQSLQDYLMSQLLVQPLSRELLEIGEKLIYNLDNNGFFLEEPHLLLEESQTKLMSKVLDIIHSFDPIGICVKNYKESLILQTKMSKNAPIATVDIIENYLPSVKKREIKILAKKLNLPPTEIENAIEFIQTLNPYPGRLFSSDLPVYVIPDIMVIIKNGEFILALNDEEIPVLGISPFFKKGQNSKPEKITRQYINKSIRDAKWFIDSIQLRNKTLLKITTAIVEFQRNFFIKGPKYLLPLILKDVAEEVGVHESTVSRISNEKYIQTEWGIYPIKYFFSNSISRFKSKKSLFSKEGTKATIRELLELETTEKPLSDQKIADRLKQHGITIARRTVAKYRSELSIDSSFER